ncbi:hypothetical protein QR680_003680 [Steinernema hermaphroditum]|uniref:7TM GPCR serpentine receptor class x (Srx) domain-containing protein n=1 Tax=Steinernema hermaphroditum TaxID=289476 RepID=A0AA39HL66_9BILA|nr:hypothetical protein QR680_003680 [Steinernema hermaphroditum]
MANMSQKEEFVFGSEMEGRGVMSTFDTVVGVSIWVMTFLAVAIGILNLCIIKKVTIFHNSFGAFWVSRTIGEIGSNIVHVVYSAPVTVFQPKDIPPTFGITIFMIGYFFAAESCSMHQFVSANRMLAVCAPLKYDNIFTRKVTRNCILFIWTSVTILMSLYILIPCQMIGYSPKYYENSGKTGWNIAAFESVILTHINNGLALIVFNPEVRRLFRGKPEAVDSTTVDLFTVDTATVVAPPKDGQ